MSVPPLYQEPHRPQIHFSPPFHWINDPNGLVWFQGRYHLFYQYNPRDKVWGDMSWGHAVSTDLIHWEHRPLALASDPEGLGHVFSGSVVVDHHGTAGFGKKALVAVFTHCSAYDVQVQSLAYSNDGGETWTQFAQNPVLQDPTLSDFRDPKVFWYEPRGLWVMSLACGDHIRFYLSPDLRKWTCSGCFDGFENTGLGVWECPDLFPLQDPSGQQKWVLLISINPGGPNGGSGTFYVVGHFDGQTFNSRQKEIRWLDHGPDFYAGVTFDNIPKTDGRRITIAWMNNWDYAQKLPTAPWRGAMTLPRELVLGRHERLFSRPVRELEQLAGPTYTQRLIPGDTHELPTSPALNLNIEIQTPHAQPWQFQLGNTKGETLTLSYDAAAQALILDRHGARHGLTAEPGYNTLIGAPLRFSAPQRLRIIRDTASLEVFHQNEEALMTAQYFTKSALTQLTFSGKTTLAANLTITTLNSIW